MGKKVGNGKESMYNRHRKILEARREAFKLHGIMKTPQWAKATRKYEWKHPLGYDVPSGQKLKHPQGYEVLLNKNENTPLATMTRRGKNESTSRATRCNLRGAVGKSETAPCSLTPHYSCCVDESWERQRDTSISLGPTACACCVGESWERQRI